ncbi:MAG: hypothetical protein RRY95_02470 [Oscillospiraceae bacterium]
MEQSKEAILKQVLAGYAGYFNITEQTVLDGLPLAAEAEFHSRDERYVLSKHAQLWAAENNEYAFFVLADTLTAEQVQTYYDAVLAEGLRRISPHGEHMCSYITLAFVADTIQPEAQKRIRKLKFSKSFCFTLRGWAEFRAAGYEVSTGDFCAGGLGQEVVKSFRQILGLK